MAASQASVVLQKAKWNESHVLGLWDTPTTQQTVILTLCSTEELLLQG